MIHKRALGYRPWVEVEEETEPCEPGACALGIKDHGGRMMWVSAAGVSVAGSRGRKSRTHLFPVWLETRPSSPKGRSQLVHFAGLTHSWQSSVGSMPAAP